MSMNNKIGSVLVIGGGIAGIQSAIDLADSGFRVYIVESGTAIGGHMAQLDKTFPTNDCAMCTISPRLVAAGMHRNIEIITKAELTRLTGKAGNFKAEITINPHFIDLEKCTGCGACVENCPVLIKDEYNQLLSTRKAIFKTYPQAVPNKYSITRMGIAPCYNGCPIHNDPSGYVALTMQGKYQEAVDLIREKNPFPSICGRICIHLCEQECNRNNIDKPVAISAIKRFLFDWELTNGRKKSIEEKQKSITENGIKIAIVGAGPSGLTAGFELRKLGYSITIFEKQARAGGMMRLTIPEYRLPAKIIDREIENILEYGIDLKLNASIINSVTEIENLFNQEFKSVFLSIGSFKSRRLNIPGEDMENISHGIDFLLDVKKGNKKSVKDNVIVIGGGNVALDCARTAVRLGAKKVSLLCLEEYNKMPAFSWEIDMAIEEGINIIDAKATKKILGEDGKYKGLETLDVKKLNFNDGRLELEIFPDSEKIFISDELIISIGQAPGLGFLEESEKIKVSAKKTIQIDEKTMMTTMDGVFAGGDVVSGAASIVESIHDGQRAAKAIDAYIKNEKPQIEEILEPIIKLSKEELKLRKEKIARRIESEKIPIKSRISSFDEVEKTLTEESVKRETERCFNCAFCSYCKQCEKACEADAILYNDTVKQRDLNIGAVILSPGFEPFDATKKEEYGYKRFPNVITSLDYERVLSATGPFAGLIKRISDNKIPKKIAFLQCIGSRDKDSPYCSSVCCMYATKQAIVTKEHLPDTECEIFVMDVRAFGKGFDEYYERAKNQYGVKYIYSRISNIKQNFANHNLLLQFAENGNNLIEQEFDLVILSIGICSSKTTIELAKKIDIDLNQFSFVKSKEFIQTMSSKNGVFLAGAVQSPKDIPESVTQGSGAAAQAMELLADVRGTEIKEKIYPEEKDVLKEEIRIGVFVCHCGSNIGGIINCKSVADYAAKIKNVVFATDLLYTCSPDGLKNIKEKITEYNLTRVVVSSCTPRTHEPLFQETIREAGLNAYLFEMANIRDQCTWVHAHLGKLTEEKAKDLIRMAVGRSRFLEPIKSNTYIPIRSALIIGGGVSGITAALSIANQGFKVFLIENSKQIGGNLRLISETIEGFKPGELLKKLENEVKSNKNISLYKNSKIAECTGSVGNYKGVINISDGDTKEIEFGIAIIATGGVESKTEEYLYGKNKQVLTHLEFEEKFKNDKSLLNNKNEIVMIQCVGSRIPDKMMCSRICCTEAVKNAITIKQQNPEINISILYRDIRTYGFKEEYYNKARELGVLFFRYDPDNQPEVLTDDSNNLCINAKDLNSNLEITFKPDYLILSTGMMPSTTNPQISEIFKVPLNLEGFFLEAHMKLRPVEFASEGIFLCGACHSPKFIDESITQAKAAAAKAAAILSKEVIEVSGVIAKVDPEKCSACLTCVRTCPYNVPRINKDGVAEIEPSMCYGCGTCASECPAKAIELNHYKDKQIIAKTEALFNKEKELVLDGK